jgi:hypothetical protein
VSDVWDNNTFPLFLAATATRRSERERRSLAALTRMAGFGTERRTWMREQAATAGYSLDALLPAPEPVLPRRDYRGRVMAAPGPLTPTLAADLAKDYELASAGVQYLLVERGGRRLDCHLKLAVPRAYQTGDAGDPALAVVLLRLEDLCQTEFDSADAHGAVLQSAFGEVVIRVGEHGVFRAARATAWPDDRLWYLSSAGRRADYVTPSRNEREAHRRPRQKGALSPTAYAAATILQHAMFEMRSVRYSGRAPHVPVEELSHALAGAGEAVLAAGSARGNRRREHAFGELIETWARSGSPALSRLVATRLRELNVRPDIEHRVPMATDSRRSDSATPRPRRSGSWPKAELRMASYAAAREEHGSDEPPSARFHFAMPQDTGDGPWRLRGLRCPGLIRFRLRTAAFHGGAPLRLDATQSAGPTFAFGEGAVSVTGGGRGVRGGGG